jgi:hypothetical protein
MGQASVTSVVFIEVLCALSTGLLLRESIRTAPTSVYIYTHTEVYLSTASVLQIGRHYRSPCSNDVVRSTASSPVIKYSFPLSYIYIYTHTHTHTHRRNLIELWKEEKQNRPWILGTSIYEGVKLESGKRLVWTSLSYLLPFNSVTKKIILRYKKYCRGVCFPLSPSQVTPQCTHCTTPRTVSYHSVKKVLLPPDKFNTRLYFLTCPQDKSKDTQKNCPPEKLLRKVKLVSSY